jgi:hypothetical protein
MKTITVALLVLLAGGCVVHERDTYRGNGQSYGAAPIGGTADHQLVCHKGKKTLSLPPSAVDAHLGHGDRRGPC